MNWPYLVVCMLLASTDMVSLFFVEMSLINSTTRKSREIRLLPGHVYYLFYIAASYCRQFSQVYFDINFCPERKVSLVINRAIFLVTKVVEITPFLFSEVRQ